MPEIDGLEFVERIKRTAKRQPEIVFTTAYEEHALRAFELAAADYLLKPIKMTRLQKPRLTASSRKPRKKQTVSPISKSTTANAWSKSHGNRRVT